MGQEAEQPQWFITADGTVLQSWPPGPDNDRLKYVRFDTTRRLELSDLYALDERLEGFNSSFNRGSAALLVLFVLDILGLLVVWLVLPRFDVGDDVTYALTAVLVLALLGGGSVIKKVSGGSRAKFEEIYLEAGFRSSVPHVIKDSEAQQLLDASGTVAGRRSGARGG